MLANRLLRWSDNNPLTVKLTIGIFTHLKLWIASNYSENGDQLIFQILSYFTPLKCLKCGTLNGNKNIKSKKYSGPAVKGLRQRGFNVFCFLGVCSGCFTHIAQGEGCRERETLNQLCLNVGPASTTLVQH